jgi:hypothetical protein
MDAAAHGSVERLTMPTAACSTAVWSLIRTPTTRGERTMWGKYVSGGEAVLEYGCVSLHCCWLCLLPVPLCIVKA